MTNNYKCGEMEFLTLKEANDYARQAHIVQGVFLGIEAVPPVDDNRAKSYTFDIKLTGYEQVTVSARSMEQAKNKAMAKFWLIYDTAPAQSLRQKSTILQFLGEM